MELFVAERNKIIINFVYCFSMNEFLPYSQDRSGSNTLCKDI